VLATLKIDLVFVSSLFFLSASASKLPSWVLKRFSQQKQYYVRVRYKDTTDRGGSVSQHDVPHI